jgi:hypothetical protein
MIKPNSPHGYYTVGDQIYLNKPEALYQASLRKQTANWHFYEDVFGAMDWTVRPTGTIRELYRQRAQQLRDNYDYIIVNFSGGSDSWTVLNSFLANGIPVDEVYTRWGRAERNYRSADPTDVDARNLGSEYEYAVVPVLEYIEKNYPKINIVVNDYSECLQGELTEKMFFQSNQYQAMPSFFRFNRKSTHELEQERKNKRIAVVHGYDKIHCTSKDGNLYSYFTDTIGGTNDDPSRQFELFYWTPDFPSIPVLQSHCIKDFFKERPEFIKSLMSKGVPPTYNEYYKLVYREVCYPDYDPNTFQVGKAQGSILWKSDAWIMHYNPTYYKSWRWATGQFTKSIDDQYLSKLSGVTVGLKPYTSPLYLVSAGEDLTPFAFSNVNMIVK